MSNTIPVGFDAEAYKATTRTQWENAAEAWHRWGPSIEAWLGESTELMLDLAGVDVGHAVLDVAAGAGGQSFAAARRVGPHGSVLATDISPAILEFAVAQARALALPQVTTLVCDGELLDVPPGSFDAVISRVGLIYLPDQHAALTSMYEALRPGGRVGAVVYSTPDRNEFFSIPVATIRRRAELPPPLAGQPGPFSLGAPGVIEAAFERAGFTDIVTRSVAAPVRMASAAECARFERESFGALHQMLAGLDPAGQDAAWAEVEAALGQFEGPDGFIGPCEMLVAVGTRADT